MLALAAAEADLTEADKQTKLRACMELTQLKVSEDVELIDQILETTTFDHRKVVDKITAEILVSCYRNIDLATAQGVLADSSFEMTESLRSILTFKTKTFKTEKQVTLTKEQIKLIAEAEKEHKPSKVLKFTNAEVFQLGSWYLPVFFVGAFGLIVYVATTALKRSKKADKKTKANKTK